MQRILVNNFGEKLVCPQHNRDFLFSVFDYCLWIDFLPLLLYYLNTERG
nr:MAG TPA: hypothetical protein [Caudoviricetes sp.]